MLWLSCSWRPEVVLFEQPQYRPRDPVKIFFNKHRNTVALKFLRTRPLKHLLSIELETPFYKLYTLQFRYNETQGNQNYSLYQVIRYCEVRYIGDYFI